MGITIEWIGQGVEEQGVDCRTGRVLVEVNPQLYRPSEVELLVGNPAKAMQKMGWKPHTSLKELVSLMIDSDLKLVARSTEKETEVCF